MPRPTNDTELRNLAQMWELQADELDDPQDIPMLEEEISESDSDKAETLRHCAGELRTLLDQGYIPTEGWVIHNVRS